ncbi:hypothetical protein ISREJYDI_CDS0062 [Pseudomonas phage UNO-G1W1]|jgi:hypothetical protein|uniref:Uncharacterized protein n=1 Tax=Pseudomonas phage UNO-G1W1 TaxID=3136609 RepID=A0AAX4MVF6_9CAUD
MNLFWFIFWSCVVIDVLVPGVNVAIGWYVLWAGLGLITNQ